MNINFLLTKSIINGQSDFSVGFLISGRIRSHSIFISPTQLALSEFRRVNSSPAICWGLIGREEGGPGSRDNVAISGAARFLGRPSDGPQNED